MLDERWIKLGPVRTRYFEAGKPDGIPVVLIHEGGYGGDAPNTYGRLVEHLSNHRLILPEMLGFGGTDKAAFFGENPYQPRLRHLASFFDAIDLPRAHFVGNSFGGGVVLRLTLDSASSWRMRSATSISGTGGPFRTDEGLRNAWNYEPSIEAARAFDEWILPEGMVIEEHAKMRFASSMRAGQWESMTSARLRNPSLPPEPDAPARDFPAALSESTVPTMLVAGTRDRMLEPGWEQKLAEHLRIVRSVRLDAAHSPNLSHPRETADELLRFFDDVERGNTIAGTS